MKHPIWSNFFRKNKETLSQVQLTLKQIPVFQGLSTRELSAIENILHRREYQKGEIIFKENTPGLGMYIILEGKVSISGRNTNNQTVNFANLETGDFFGEVSLIDESFRSANATSETECHLVAFFKEELMHILKHSPKLGNKLLLNLAQVISSRLKKTNESLQNLSG